jgi:hypothetical protein
MVGICRLISFLAREATMPFAVRCYIVAVGVAALGVVVAAPWASGRPLTLLILCVLAATFERASWVKISARSTVSMSLVVSIAVMFILPPLGAGVVGFVTGLARPRASTWWKTSFNVSMMTVVLAASASVSYVLGGEDSGALSRYPSFLVPFFGTVTACWLLNSLLLAIAIRLSGEARFWEVWRSDIMRAAMPFFSSSILSLILTALWYDKALGIVSIMLILLPVYVGHWVLAQYSREQAAYESTISALVQAVEIKDHYTRGHSERVARGAELIARQLAMAEGRVAKLRYAGLLHDIGKLGVPTRVLAKTGKLTDDEYAQICQHPSQGIAVVRDITFLTEVYEGILYHHERLDGRGYPTGKAGDQIPEFARIIGVADAFDAMTSTRSYRAARPVSEALTELWRGAGTQFDPGLVRAFEEALALQEAAGHPWQVTEEPVVEAEPDSDVLVLDQRREYSFGDHDDPAVEEEWYGDRVGVGRQSLRDRPDWATE